MSHKRRLAAIMFTDIQGYTRLMQESEERAVSIRARHRQVFDPLTQKFNGTVIQYYGDGTLSIFESCVDAVRCGCEMQARFQMAPSIPVRVGIHVGDILLDEDDIIGDSVNLASRIESLGVPGSVLISRKVYEEIKNHDGFPVKSLGKFQFKNDATQREVFAVAKKELVVPKRRDLSGKLEQSTKGKFSRFLYPFVIAALLLGIASFFGLQNFFSSESKVDRLAVLPFENRLGDATQAYLIGGIQEELILKLAKAGIKVLSYTSMKNYDSSNKTVRNIASELAVDALVEGSIARMGNELKIRVQLINGEDDEYLMKPLEKQADPRNILNLYSEVVQSLAAAIELELSPEIQQLLASAKAVNPEAYDLFLKGRYYLNKGTAQGLEESVRYFNESLQHDPEFGQVYSGLVESYLLQGFGILNSEEAHEQFRLNVEKAKALDEDFASDHHQLAMIKIFSEWDWKGAEKELKLAIKSQPKAWEPHDSYCQFLWAMGRWEESIAAGRQAVQNDPKSHFARCDLAWAYFFADQPLEAHKELRILEELHGTDCPHHAALDVFLDIDRIKKAGGKYDKVIEQLQQRKKQFPKDLENVDALLGYAYALDGQKEEAFKIAERMKSSHVLRTAGIYLALGDNDSAMEILEEEFEQRSFILVYVIKSAPWLDPIRNDPRFKDLLNRMGLS